MKKTFLWGLAVAALLSIPFAGAALAERAMFVHADNDFVEAKDLSEMYDGETRVLGEGEHQVTIVRSGDEIRITTAGENRVKEIVCRAGIDSCKAIETEDGKTMLLVSRKSDCDGKGDCASHEVRNLHFGPAGGHGNNFVFRGSAMGATACEEGEECDVDVIVRHAGEMLHEMRLDGDAPHVIRWHGKADKAHLRCPEGDATLTVELKEADDTFLCPKHAVPLEKDDTHQRFMKKIEVRSPSANEY